MRHSYHTNYQTNFRIDKAEDEGLFDHIITLIYKWLKTEEHDSVLAGGEKYFHKVGKWKNCSQTRANIYTWRADDEFSNPMWTLDYSLPDKELDAKRFWHTFVGLREVEDSVVVSVRVAYSWNDDDLAIEEQKAPSPSVPQFVRHLVDSRISYSGQKAFRLMSKPLSLSDSGTGQLLHSLVFSPERRYPIIIFNGDSEDNKEEAHQLASQLTGKAQVFVVASRPELNAELKEIFPYEWGIVFHQMRVFFPIITRNPRPGRHRFFDVANPSYHQQREGIIHGLLRNHILLDPKGIETLEDLRRERSRAALSRLKRFEGTAGSPEEIEFLKELSKEQETLIHQLEEKVASAKADADYFASQHDEVADEVKKLKWQVANEHLPSPANTTPAPPLISLPQNLNEVAKAAAIQWKRQLDFAQEAFDSAAKDSSKCDFVNEAWEILAHLATTLHKLKFGETKGGDLAQQFEAATGYSYSKTEGPATKGDAVLAKMRVIEHGGKTYKIWAHIKKGVKPPKMVRVHFDFNEDDQKIVIGFIGLHMPNSTTRKIG